MFFLNFGFHWVLVGEVGWGSCSKREPDKKSAQQVTAGQDKQPAVTSQPDQNENQVSDEIMNFSGLRTTCLLCAFLSFFSNHLCLVFSRGYS